MKLFKQKNNKKVKMGRTLEGTIFEVSFTVLAILLWGFISWLSGQAPSTIAIHFDLQGNPNGWGTPGHILFACGITTIVGIAMMVFAYFPHMINLPVEVRNFRQYTLVSRMTRIMAIEILLLTLCMALTTLGSGIGWNIPAKVLILSTIGVILATTIICCVLIHKAGAQ